MNIPDSAKHLCHILLTHADNGDLWYVKEDRYSWVEVKWVKCSFLAAQCASVMRSMGLLAYDGDGRIGKTHCCQLVTTGAGKSQLAEWNLATWGEYEGPVWQKVTMKCEDV